MSRKAGPFLKFCEGSSTEWTVSVLFVTDQDTAPDFAATIGTKKLTTTAKNIYEFQTSFFWTFRLKISRTTKQQVVSYQLDEQGKTFAFSFFVPAKDTIPAMAYGSCAGFHSARDAQQYGSRKNERWQNMLQRQQILAGEVPGDKDPEEQPFHLLLMGGDQVYADAIWSDRREASSIVNWFENGQSTKAKFSSLMENQTERFYLRLYQERWTQSGPAEAYASIPSIMMWDDHDIFDGWGSYEPALQNCAVHQGIFAMAAKYFRLFQHHSAEIADMPGLLQTPATADGNMGVGFSLGSMAIVAPDLRSSRTSTQVLGRTNMDALINWIDGLNGQLKPKSHLVVMLSLPLMYPAFSWIESALGLLPGAQDLEDDVRDHWTSRPHREERLRLIHRLLNFARAAKCRVTILSGDVHVAAVSTITANPETSQSNLDVINQLISSALVNGPPPATAMFFLNHVAGHKEEIDRDIEGEMKTFPNTSTNFIAKRNWLSLQPDSSHRIWAKLHAEGEDAPYVKVIHPGD